MVIFQNFIKFWKADESACRSRFTASTNDNHYCLRIQRIRSRNKALPYFDINIVIITDVHLSSADLTAAIDTASEECQQRCGDNIEQGNDLIRGELRSKQRNQSTVKGVPHG